MRIVSSVHIKVEHSILRAPKSTPRSQGARMVQLASARPSMHEVPRLIRGDITSLFWVQLLSFLCSFDQLLIPLKRSIDGGGWKWAHHRAQIYQLLLSRVIDVKYGCFTFFCTTWVPACPNNESVSNLQREGLVNECSFGLFGFQFDEWKATIFIGELRL